MERHVLVVFPHPDDEAFGVSGTLAMHAEKGTPITYACLTLGEMGRNMGTPPFANRETLPLIRKQELKAACEAIGIDDLRLLGFRDKTIEFEDEELIADRISAIIAETNPSLIITFYPGYSVHPDHDACGAAVIHAVQRIPKEERPIVHCVAFAKNCEQDLGKPDIVRDVSAVIDKKIAAIQAHRSQTEGLMSAASKRGGDALEWLKTERFWTYKWEN
ncbi:bacillithiol biosynthesis deacetylase BshB2 [Anoxybacillus sp. B7M1]|uniref:Bacillithiol biosynthesis deacetylase BshB2 n=1 Tax=Anoxybacteroides rupiense TaxID=311460 RepID=A0ABD5IXT8_9BACL|nr:MULTISPECIES: bacillithiol biosynthesis deacetylase BshB2 [Anoxybacillus]ANB58277.1 bacillithiol biosynthesis deacetylase BshB2 [Anoxybacillus sp. B2M1]ANB63962.1 bacillithiol biosynthesis deacetylase BshB2 [Anoxybacillus sp. B7M1]KXG10891.1 1D-myo-inositol 2-acetamido-2-deoxy-alpha-D-glucopyranoside deacetylase [Anoxybacillus sp. P3H1B]MBB3907846.1 bacillithiol biosynthesis deacetylase BshB2 [Anoxybacillus rupiensis]MBS2772866.1 bacillithiol biosynthesis deacetylase BshB2 [Anoxybacillus ru